MDRVATWFGIVSFGLALLLPAAVSAQTGTVAGVVRDATGAVLPGVTVEAASPELIEKARSVITDDQGQYKVIDLRPGIYTVTFSLAGFNTVKREGIELTTSFTASVNAELGVGTVNETITVSGVSPVVDVQNTVQQRVMTRDILDAIPTSKTVQSMAALVPGMVISGFGNAQDVGGQVGDNQVQMQIHGGRPGDTIYQMDGMRFNNLSSGGSYGQVQQNITTQEVSVETGAISAEVEAGGVRINLIPKAGGNTYKGSVIGSWTNHALQTNNLSNDLQSRGLLSVDRVDKVWDAAVGFGGPLRKDRLWFYGGASYNYRQNFLAGLFFDKDPLDFTYDPDPSRPGPEDLWDRVDSLRLTWQATARNKFNVYFDDRDRCVCHWYLTSLVAPEASSVQGAPQNNLGQVTWTSPLTNRLLIEAGYSIFVHNWTSLAQPGVAPTTYAFTDAATGWRFRAPSSIGIGKDYNTFPVFRGSLSYVTGSHAVKVGFNMNQGTERSVRQFNNDATLTTNNGVPISVTYQAPTDATDHVRANLGIFAQDQWTMRRLTFNLGVRFDYMHSVVPPQSVKAGLYIPARQFPDQVDCVPCWKDINPRVGASFDLFGNGKTALKGSLSRYDVSQIVALAIANNPVTTTSNSATRAWTDSNGDFIPQGDPLNPLPNGELTGPLTNANFGKVVATTTYDPAVLNGWSKRPYDWEVIAGVQHELRPRVSANAAYIRRWYGNFTATDNLLRTPADYDPFCVTAPLDSRLPGGGGTQICGLYDVTPTKFSATTNNLVTFANHYGTQREVYDGLDLTINARLPNGMLLAGGLNTGRTRTDACFVVDSPQLQFCKVSPPFLPQIKVLGAYTLPLDLQLSGTFQSLAGPQILATRATPVAEISPSLGRPLAGNVATAAIQLIEPGTQYGDRLNQLDFRVLRNFRLHGAQRKLQVMLDLYNAFNASPVVFQNNNYGPQWQRPTSILSGRLIKLGAQLNF
jgi:hypothetical protein